MTHHVLTRELLRWEYQLREQLEWKGLVWAKDESFRCTARANGGRSRCRGTAVLATGLCTAHGGAVWSVRLAGLRRDLERRVDEHLRDLGYDF